MYIRLSVDENAVLHDSRLGECADVVIAVCSYKLGLYTAPRVRKH